VRQTGAYCHRMPGKKLGPTADVGIWTAEVLRDPTPPRRRIYSPGERDLLQSALSRWQGLGYVEPSHALVQCNPLFVPKKSGDIRTCIDYQPINEVIADFEWPLPRIQDVRHWVCDHTWFSRLDLLDAYHSLTVPEPFRPLTAFQTPWGGFQFTVMPFGLKTAVSVFQRKMDVTLIRHKDHGLWYIDDTLVRGKTRTECRQRTGRIVRALQQGGFQINWKKSVVAVQRLGFCGLQIGPEGITVGTEIARLRDWGLPVTKKDKQSLLGFANYFRENIPGFAGLAAPLYPDGEGRIRASDLREATERLVEGCMKHVMTHHFNYDQSSQLFTDASKYAVSGVLSQGKKIVGIFSKGLTPAQSRYSTTDREHLALVLAVEKFRIFVQSNKTLAVRTDHQALLDRRSADLTPRQERWRYRVVSIAPIIEYVRGMENPADYWSRKGNAWTKGGHEEHINGSSPLSSS